MKIGIHKNENSFAARWIKYCEDNHIEYKIVNAYDNDIVQQLDDCDVFMWHHHHAKIRDVLFAKQLLYSLQTSGKKVFPDFYTGWHFDDKLGQKYLLESIHAPLAPSYVFYSKKEALEWLNKTSFPKVFKLRGGAGARNVRLVHSYSDGKKLVNKAFGSGFSQFDRIGDFKERFYGWRNGRGTFMGVLKGIGRLFYPTDFARMKGREKGYVYFQEYIPNNSYDIRVIVINGKAFAIKRLCREGDFRASGSGRIVFSKVELDEKCVELSFKVSRDLNAQCIAYDWVFDPQGNPLIVEICYGFAVKAYDQCEGYWTEDMEWHEGDHFDFCGWMVECAIGKK